MQFNYSRELLNLVCVFREITALYYLAGGLIHIFMCVPKTGGVIQFD